ncbi:MAG: hypothetical protein GTN69_01870 [Armatimonadetes bacterium]|nr:hypothetical protein [Armatimonadota bacterium]
MAAGETPTLLSGSGFTAGRIQPINYTPVDGDWVYAIGSDVPGVYEYLEIGAVAGVTQEVHVTDVTLLDFAIGMRQTEAETAATIRGLGITYPTGFIGGEQFVLAIDGGSNQTITFTADDQTLDEAVDRFNATLTGAVASSDNGQLRLTSATTGTSSEIDIVSGTAVSKLGFNVATYNGEHITFKLVCEVDGTVEFTLQPDAGESVRYVTRTVNVYDLVGLVTVRFYMEAVA